MQVVTQSWSYTDAAVHMLWQHARHGSFTQELSE